MNKKLTICALFFSVSVLAQKKDVVLKTVESQTINFQNLSFEELKAKAKKEGKPIFINIYMSTCMPCKEMESEVFTNLSVANHYNSTFINASYDYNDTEGQMLAEQYQTACAPTFLYIDSDGTLLHRRTGFADQDNFLNLAKEASDPKKQLHYFDVEYPNRKSDKVFLLSYLRLLDKANCFSRSIPFLLNDNSELSIKRELVFNEYFALQPIDSLINKSNWEAIRDFVYDYKSREFKYLLKNAAIYRKLYNKEEVDQKIKDVILTGNRLFCSDKGYSKSCLQAYTDEIKALNSPETEVGLFWLALSNAKADSEWAEFMRLVNEYETKFIVSAEDKEFVAHAIYQNIMDTIALTKAEQLMKSALAEQQSWLIYETYANVLFHLNKKQEAKLMATKALEVAKQVGAKKHNYNSITYLLELIEQLK
jgi:thiol-disulfide isomerase/thioredoxin